MYIKCYFCNKNINANRPRPNIYKGNKIFICQDCYWINTICKECNKEFKIKVTKKRECNFCCRSCSSKYTIKIAQEKSRSKESCAKREKTMQENGEAKKRLERLHSKETVEKRIKAQKELKVGIYDVNHQIKASQISIKNQKATNSGIFDPKIRKENQRKMKEKGVGIYDPEVIKKAHLIQKENNLGFYNRENARIAALKSIDAIKELSKDKDWVAVHPNFHPTNFTEKDGVVLYKGVPWEEVKKKFLSSIPKPLEYWANEFGGVIQPTFRVNKYNWEGKTAFEQSLLDNNIAWFVYIKFFISKNDNTIVPLVVGKTGSLLVNDSGSDISFDYKNENDNRPARLFIEENNNVDWYKNFIVIIPCSTENDALMLEYNIKMKYNLFNS